MHRRRVFAVASLAALLIWGCTFSVSSRAMGSDGSSPVDPASMVVFDDPPDPSLDSISVAEITVRCNSEPDMIRIRERVRNEAARYGADTVYRISISGRERDVSFRSVGARGGSSPVMPELWQGAVEFVYQAVRHRKQPQPGLR